MGLVQTVHVLVWPEERHLLIMGYVPLQSLETLYTVMQSSIGRLELERDIGSNDRCLPASILFIIVDIQDVVSAKSTKCIGMVLGRFGLELLTLDELKIFPLLQSEYYKLHRK